MEPTDPNHSGYIVAVIVYRSLLPAHADVKQILEFSQLNIVLSARQPNEPSS
jgi:hypothetical protein